MKDEPRRREAKSGSLPVAPSMGPAIEAANARLRARPVDLRVVVVSAAAVALAAVAACVAQLLAALIGAITNLVYFGRLSTSLVSPGGHHLGGWAVLVPVLGGVAVGAMARWGSRAIRGHGIPEAMEQVLTNQSRIPARMTFLKPLSAAIAIGTGGPFGAEGPIIATGGALGSLLGQIGPATATERKTLLAAGAAAGMAATFGSPLSAVLLAVELLLFEFRPRSLIPVALAATMATAVRAALVGTGPAFAMPAVAPPGGEAMAAYVMLGAALGLVSVVITRLIYAIEDSFERLPLHWMWWPALGGLAVGLVGLVAPATLGVGYSNIEQILGGEIGGRALALLVLWKLVSWSLSLGSGTSGGTLAPLFTIGGGLGALLASAMAALWPAAGIDPRVGALVGMAATFAGASHAVLASVVFAFETTRQPLGLLPLLGGCAAAYLLSTLLMRNSIMTEKIARRGIRVGTEYSSDFLDQVLARDAASRDVVTLRAGQPVGAARAWLGSRAAGSSHQGFPVLDEDDRLIGVVTRRDLDSEALGAEAPVRSAVKRPPLCVFEDSSLRDAADLMASEGIGRLPVVDRQEPSRLVGLITRSDLIAAHRRRLDGLTPRPPLQLRGEGGKEGKVA